MRCSTMEDYILRSDWLPHAERRDRATRDRSRILKDSAFRLELAGFTSSPFRMSPLNCPSQARSSFPDDAMLYYHGINCKRSKLRSRARSADAVSSCKPPIHTSPFKILPSSQPIAGDVFAMHPELFASPTRNTRSMEANATFSPNEYIKPPRQSSRTGLFSPATSTSIFHSRSVIFIDLPTQ